jgi:hypothetical protein
MIGYIPRARVTEGCFLFFLLFLLLRTALPWTVYFELAGMPSAYTHTQRDPDRGLRVGG